ncbi:hypothetical protein IKF63_01000, partial [Candidatus Saccharibacteria bacterium]|nr:hypothetical protein [Candidatus Saccharibacteria bacterium]
MLKKKIRFGNLSKKAKLGLVALALFSAGLTGFGVVMAAKIGATAHITSGTVFYYGQYYTKRYTVKSGKKSYNGICIEPSKMAPNDTDGTIQSVSHNRAGYKEMVQILLVTDVIDPNGNGGIDFYSLFLQEGEIDSWKTEIASMTAADTSSWSEKDAAFVAAHLLVGYIYEGTSTGITDMDAFNTLREKIASYFAIYFPNSYNNYTFYRAKPSSSSYQAIGWLEYAPQLAQFRIRKVDSVTGEPIAGVKIIVDVYPDTDDTYGGVSTTGSNGYTEYFSVPVNEQAVYYEDPDQTIPGYIVGDGQGTVETFSFTPTTTGVQADSLVTPIMNTPIPTGGVKIKKQDAETGGTGQGQATVKGIQYGIYSDSGCTNLEETLTLNSSGVATSSSDYNAGTTHYIKEIAGSAVSHGYVASNAVKNFTVPSGGGTVDLTSSPFTNTVIKGGLKIKKAREVYNGTSTILVG